MKIISIQEITTKEGTGKTTSFELDTRKGLFFKLEATTFHTPEFSINEESAPVVMNHADRSPFNVSLKINGTTLEITQGYQQAETVFLYTLANDDWVDANELHSIIIAAKDILAVHCTNTRIYNVATSYSGSNVTIRTTNVTALSSPIYVDGVFTKDGFYKTNQITLNPHQYSTDPVRYDYYQGSASYVITVYTSDTIKNTPLTITEGDTDEI